MEEVLEDVNFGYMQYKRYTIPAAARPSTDCYSTELRFSSFSLTLPTLEASQAGRAVDIYVYT